MLNGNCTVILWHSRGVNMHVHTALTAVLHVTHALASQITGFKYFYSQGFGLSCLKYQIHLRVTLHKH